jgi:hypothetical protein
MQKTFLSLILLIISNFSYAEILEQNAIPQSIMDEIYKKHSGALSFTAEKTAHFGQELYKVHYKDGEEKFVDYYRPDGRLFVSGHIIAADDMMFTDSKEKLKAEFNDYDITNAILVVNPNGTGEEFDIILESGGKNWNVLIDKKGNLQKKESN